MLFGGGSAPVNPSDAADATSSTSFFSSFTGNGNNTGAGGTTTTTTATTSSSTIEISSSPNSSSGSFSLPSWLRNPLTAGVEEVEGDIDPCESCKLSRQQRIVGFLACFSLGTALSIMSAFTIAMPSKFAISYSIGNVMSVASSGFLVGPKTQCKYACAPVRIWAFIFFILSLIATLISALVVKKMLLTLFFLIIQVASGLWYAASYVPYGRQMLQSCVTSCLGRATASVSGGV
jgi:hypothetical protein